MQIQNPEIEQDMDLMTQVNIYCGKNLFRIESKFIHQLFVYLYFSGRHDSISETQSLGSSYGTPQSLPTFQHPSHALLSENGFTQLQYSKYHSRCLKGTTFFLNDDEMMICFLYRLIIPNS